MVIRTDIIQIFPDCAVELTLPIEVHSVYKWAINAGSSNFLSLYFVSYASQFVHTI